LRAEFLALRVSKSIAAVFLGSAVGGGLVLSVRDKGKGRRGNKFIFLFWEIPSSLIPLP
jgi:hypothetical protein